MVARNTVQPVPERVKARTPHDLAVRAAALVDAYPECFWTWRPDARVETAHDVRLVIWHLREHGDHRAWAAAQELQRIICGMAQRASSGNTVETEWAIDSAADSAYRFFPIERDPLLGWRLHLFDAATNKALTLAARTETRDYVDIVELSTTFPLAAICWAACGKDPGFTPLSLLAMMRRFARVDPAELEKIRARDIDPVALKSIWTDRSDAAGTMMTTLADTRPEVPIGVAFVDATGHPGWIGDDPTLRVHTPSVRGCWPTVR